MTNHDFLTKLRKYIEDVEQRIEGEWGACRPLKSLIKNGEMPPVYYEVIGRLLEEKK